LLIKLESTRETFTYAKIWASIAAPSFLCQRVRVIWF